MSTQFETEAELLITDIEGASAALEAELDDVTVGMGSPSAQMASNAGDPGTVADALDEGLRLDETRNELLRELIDETERRTRRPKLPGMGGALGALALPVAGLAGVGAVGSRLVEALPDSLPVDAPDSIPVDAPTEIPVDAPEDIPLEKPEWVPLPVMDPTEETAEQSQPSTNSATTATTDSTTASDPAEDTAAEDTATEATATEESSESSTTSSSTTEPTDSAPPTVEESPIGPRTPVPMAEETGTPAEAPVQDPTSGGPVLDPNQGLLDVPAAAEDAEAVPGDVSAETAAGAAAAGGLAGGAALLESGGGSLLPAAPQAGSGTITPPASVLPKALFSLDRATGRDLSPSREPPSEPKSQRRKQARRGTQNETVVENNVTVEQGADQKKVSEIERELRRLKKSLE